MEDLFLIGHDMQLRSAKAVLAEMNKELCDNHELLSFPRQYSPPKCCSGM